MNYDYVSGDQPASGEPPNEDRPEASSSGCSTGLLGFILLVLGLLFFLFLRR